MPEMTPGEADNCLWTVCCVWIRASISCVFGDQMNRRRRRGGGQQDSVIGRLQLLQTRRELPCYRAFLGFRI